MLNYYFCNMHVDFVKNYQNFKIYFTIFLVWVSVQFDVIVEDSIAFILILSIGLLHGANDILILSGEDRLRKKKIQNLVVYSLISITCVGIYLIHDYVAILLFIIISSYHFGEEHLSSRISEHNLFDIFYYTFFGLIIFSLIFFTSIVEVNAILSEMVNAYFTESGILLALIASVSITVLLSIYLLIKKKLSFTTIGLEFFNLLLLFLVFKATSLIFGFAIYFVFWHSFPSIIGQIQYISKKVDNKSMLYYIKKASPFWFVSVLGLAVLFWVFPEINVFATFVFAVLFAVTAPHIWVMYRMKH